jgi:hypothetical protein
MRDQERNKEPFVANESLSKKNYKPRIKDKFGLAK